MGFTLRVVELGADQDGDQVTTCVACELDCPARRGPSLTSTEAKARRFLADLIAVEGEPLPAASGFPTGLRGVPEIRWRDECESRRLSTADTKDGRGRAFRRAFATLLQTNVVAARDAVVWLTHPD